MTVAPNGLNRKATHGPSGKGEVRGVAADQAHGSLRRRATFRHGSRFRRAMRTSAGFSSTPTTARNGIPRRAAWPGPCRRRYRRTWFLRSVRPAGVRRHRRSSARKHRGSHAKVGSRVAVVGMAALQMTSGDQPAGPQRQLAASNGWRVNPSATVSPGRTRRFFSPVLLGRPPGSGLDLFTVEP